MLLFFLTEPKNPRHVSILDVPLAAQLYYQSNGHVVHCKILYIESIVKCILAAPIKYFGCDVASRPNNKGNEVTKQSD